VKLSDVLALQKKKKTTSNAEKKTRPKATPVAKGKSEIKVVRTRETPNPSALQFVLNSQIVEHGNLSYESKKDCGEDQLCKILFDKPEVKTIDSNVTLYKSDKGAKLNIDVEKFLSFSNDEKLDAVEMVLDRSIRKNLAQDGGGVEVKGINGNIVEILYQGACGSCPTSSTGTLQYIQTQIRQQLHKDLEVKSV
jgi:Fe-S cluster biogenesis protein NfuA